MFDINFETVLKIKEVRQQLETQAQNFKRPKDKIGIKDVVYLNALSSPIFTDLPESKNAEVLDVASAIIKYS